MNLKIRTVSEKDANIIYNIENQCFPPLEAADLETIKDRLSVFSDCFFIVEDESESPKDDDVLNGAVGFICGAYTDYDRIFDEMFSDAQMHSQNAQVGAIYSLGVIEKYRRCGIGGMLLNAFIEKCKNDGKRKVILTCKEEKIQYYSKFGFENMGISQSLHGGVRWYDMAIDLGK